MSRRPRYRPLNDLMIEHLLSIAQVYMDEEGISMAQAGKLAKNGDTQFFVKLVDGADSKGRKVSTTFRSMDEILQWFSDNWPEDVKWPELPPVHIVRPPPSS